MLPTRDSDLPLGDVITPRLGLQRAVRSLSNSRVPSVDPSSTIRISFSRSTVWTRRTISSIVARSLKTGITTDSLRWSATFTVLPLVLGSPLDEWLFPARKRLTPAPQTGHRLNLNCTQGC